MSGVGGVGSKYGNLKARNERGHAPIIAGNSQEISYKCGLPFTKLTGAILLASL